MSFDFSTLITDRSQADVEALRALLAVPLADWTAEQLAEFNQALSKGAYNYTDLNRVTACMDYLNEVLTALGYQTGYQRIVVPHQESGGGGTLPEGYTQVAWIESMGSQYIDTEFNPSSNTRVIAEVEFLPKSSPTWLFAGRVTANDRNFGFLTLSNYYRSDFDAENTSFTTTQTFVGKFKLDKNENVTTLNDTYTVISPASTFSTPYSLVIFGCNTAGIVSGFCSAKVYSFQIYENESLVRDYIPCTNQTGEAGLYDLVNDQFYGNAGTGEFIAAPIPVEMPDGYTQLEYIESHAGSSTDGQFINSGLLPNSETQAYIDYQFTSVSNHTHVAVLGSRVDNGGTYPGRWIFAYNGSAWRFDYNNANYSSSAPDGWSTRHQVTINKNVLTFNDGRTITASQGVFSGEYPLYIFANNTGGRTGECSNLRIWYARIDNQSEIAEFIPCKNPDGEIGLYNLTNGQFHANQGNGAFSGGPEIELSAPELEPTPELDPYTWYETDAPTVSAMAGYLANVEALRGVLEQGSTPEVPADMAGLTAEEANAIEEILLVIEGSLTAMQKIFLRSGMAWAISGEPGFYFAN